MISPRGGDLEGDLVAEAALAADVDEHPFIFLDRKTPSYTAVLEANGNLVIALADMDLYSLFTPRRLQMRQVREQLQKASAILCDANLPAETLVQLSLRAQEMGVGLSAIAISPAKVVRYLPILGGLRQLFMNEAEAEAIAGVRPDLAADWPRVLRAAGLNGGAVTRGGNAAVLFDAHHAVSLTPPVPPSISDVTGAGDSFAAGVMSAQLRGEPLAEAIRWGTAAALITLGSPLACAPGLSPDALQNILPLVPEAEILS